MFSPSLLSNSFPQPLIPQLLSHVTNSLSHITHSIRSKPHPVSTKPERERDGEGRKERIIEEECDVKYSSKAVLSLIVHVIKTHGTDEFASLRPNYSTLLQSLSNYLSLPFLPPSSSPSPVPLGPPYSPFLTLHNALTFYLELPTTLAPPTPTFIPGTYLGDWIHFPTNPETPGAGGATQTPQNQESKIAHVSGNDASNFILLSSIYFESKVRGTMGDKWEARNGWVRLMSVPGPSQVGRVSTLRPHRSDATEGC
eukprot:CAMPEP_0118662450 /NCGR_PEP_ID=MMETSP0785-20121206/16839_1 /TAXON_ID=91992 /ORGANISM="Bolidomonas pacifica, Strain CCMP 1866" /LENGTH=254 /DNA_ID=CAMNT_0006555997 /DNA_START=116 /DNA_END=877 /DNA_ORIENTATION=-